jgi:hypothetical protein
MSLIEQFKNHPIHANLQAKLDEIAQQLENDSYSEDQKDSLLAYQLLLTNIKVVLSSKTAQLSPIVNLNELNQSIQSLNMAYCANLNGQPTLFNNIYVYLRKIPYFEKKSEIKQSFNQLIENFVKKQDEIKTRIDSEIQQFQQKQDEKFNDLDTKSQDFENTINNLKKESDGIQKGLEEVDAATKLFIVKTSEKYESQLNELKISFQEEANQTLSEMKQRKDDVEKLWGIIGKSATVGQSKSYADDAKSFADTMMWICVALMTIGLIFIGISTWKFFLQPEFNYIDFVGKVLVSAVVLIPALYCANISKLQRDREFQLRDFEVKVAALEPFMESMAMHNTEDNTEKDKVKLELTKSFFDKQFAKTNKHNDSILIPKEFVKILRDFAKNGSKLNLLDSKE